MGEGLGPAGEQAPDLGLDGLVELFGGNDAVYEAEALGLAGVHAGRGQEQAPRLALAHGGDDVGGDDRGGEAEPGLAQGEGRRVGGDGNVAAGDGSDPAARSCEVRPPKVYGALR